MFKVLTEFYAITQKSSRKNVKLSRNNMTLSLNNKKMNT